MNGAKDFEPLETLSIAVSNRVYQLMQSYAAKHDISPSSIVETAVKEFLDIIERCDPEARAVARELSRTDE